MMKRRIFTKSMAMAAALTFAGTAYAQETTLKLAHYGSATDSVTKAAEKFAELVSEKTGGALAIDLFGNGELGNSPTMLEGVRLGTIDIVTVGNPFFTGSLPQLNLLDLPFLFQSDAHAFAVLDGEVGQSLMGSMSEAGLQGLAFWELGFRNLTNNVRPIEGPADLAGLKIRTTPNPAHVLAFETLGANPTPMPFAEVYSALQTGTIDGQENPVNHIHANKLNEVQKYMSLTAHAYTTSPLVMNAGRWNGLSPEFQTAISEAAIEAASFQRGLNDEEETSSLEAMKAEGLEVVETPDQDAFRAAVSEVTRAAYVESFGTDLLDKVDAAAN
ncbi:TRAP transporter substrate-binding protein [uncultured Hoeflea sp.]|uniref:TRAP transporter substrate-binding protein n=1 Tax=uncultured Hoeflea sp. TaxID=538666 RepID=UPI0026270513|nr:TRAP transporter substrate-binding protein [uncultured Hoeflea sp.]